MGRFNARVYPYLFGGLNRPFATTYHRVLLDNSEPSMLRSTELKLPLTALPLDARRASDAPSETDQDRAPVAHPVAALTALASQALGIAPQAIQSLAVFKRSFDARKADILAVFIVDICLDATLEAQLLARFANHPHIGPTPDMAYTLVAHAPATPLIRPVVVGFGPCGIFAALLLAQMGFKPIVLERGPAVRQRTKDTWDLWRKNTLHPESNVQFGEGGAGTFSDGKLWSQIKDPRYLGRKVMQELVQAGAPADILVEAHPHIGTFKLVKVVENLRAQIIALGGEVRFGQRVIDLDLAADPCGLVLRGLRVLDIESGQTQTLEASHVVMALGHSARDTFAMLYRRGVAMQAKPFSVGFRIEHPQSVIDRARWGRHAGHPLLGAADYKLVHHARNGRGVYSFCMCPGGTVVAATSEAQRVVTNGMSQYSRNERNANAGIVVGISPQDYRLDRNASGPVSPLDGIVFQRFWESRAYVLGGENYRAPAQLLGDFVAGRHGRALARDFGSVLPSYQPGVTMTDLAEPGRGSLPDEALVAIREALPAFERQIRGFAMADAVLTGVETRTSSPLRITRGKDLQSLNVAGLYPAGEGAGYAGGIMSAGVDGIEVAEALGLSMLRAVA